VYEVIKEYGGPEKFYNDFYISSVSPLGFIQTDKKGREKNYNYYDRPDLTEAVYDFMVDNIRKQIALGISTDTCICLGTGKNEKFLRSLNEKYGFFGRIFALEHPRFVMQYRAKRKDEFVAKYIEVSGKAVGSGQ
jgi:hypothetical protein